MSEPTTQPAIRVQGITKMFRIPLDGKSGIKQHVINAFKHRKGYRNFKPLDNVSFEIQKGEFFGIVGRNGSGKSTLLKLIAGIYTPDKGSVKVNGLLVPFIELGVGFNPELTGRENVFLNGALLGFSRPEIAAMYEEIVDFAELHDFMEERLKNYSSGMQVRLAFSIAIRARGDILLLDEVLAVGDSAFQQKCFDYFEKIKEEHKTIILVTHSMETVKRFCSRALLLQDGEIKLIGSPEEIADQYLLDNIQSLDKNTTSDDRYQTKIRSEKVQAIALKRTSKKDLTESDELSFDFTYKLSQDVEPAVAFTIKKDGISIAEMNSLDYSFPSAPGAFHTVSFSTPLEAFNPGAYSIDIAIIEKKNRSLMAFKLRADEFIIKGKDETRGGAINLKGKWSSNTSSR